jgi:RNA polymerase sigma-70 factor (ECF subfamily)
LQITRTGGLTRIAGKVFIAAAGIFPNAGAGTVNKPVSPPSMQLCLTLPFAIPPARPAAKRILSAPAAGLASRGMFPNTRWTELAQATLSGEDAGRAALDAMCRSYWEPVRRFALQRGWRHDEVQDLTQSFFLYLMEKGVLRQAEREKGRFRCFLQGVLNNFLLNERQRRRTQKRGGGMEQVELTDDSAATEDAAGLEFDRHWARTLVAAALQRVSAECTAKHGEEFYSVIAVFIGGSGELISQEQAAEKLGMSAGRFRTEVFTWRQKFRESLRAEVRRTVSAPHEVDDEVRYLWQLLTSA